MFRSGLILATCVYLTVAGNHARAQDLVIGGEHIADAKTVALAKAEPKLVLYSTYVSEAFARYSRRSKRIPVSGTSNIFA